MTARFAVAVASDTIFGGDGIDRLEGQDGNRRPGWWFGG